MAAHDKVPGTCYQVGISTGFTANTEGRGREALLEGMTLIQRTRASAMHLPLNALQRELKRSRFLIDDLLAFKQIRWWMNFCLALQIVQLCYCLSV